METAVTTYGLAEVSWDETTSDEPEREIISGKFYTKQGTVESDSVLLHERIGVDPNILNGEPHIRGTRIPIAVILNGLNEGLSRAELIEHYPRLTPEDITAVLEHDSSIAIM